MIDLPEPPPDRQWLAIETYKKKGESSRMLLRARALPGQGFPLDYKVECSTDMRKKNPEGSYFLIQGKITKGTEKKPSIYSHKNWPYKKVSYECAINFISTHYKT